jgi:adenine-specific DNA methylase
MFRILDGSRLSEILHSVKSFTANQANRILGRTGPFWLDESFDHIVRNSEEWEEKLEYICQNPVKKGLVQCAEDYPFLYLRRHRQDACATVEFEVFQPKSEKEVPPGTVTRARATCPACNVVLPPGRVRAQLAAQRGGADVIFDEQGRRTGGARLLAVVTLKPGEQGRHYRLPTEADYRAVWKAQQRLKQILEEWERGGRKGLCPVPDERISLHEIRRISVPIYGMVRWGDLFAARQALSLLTLSELVRKAEPTGCRDLLAFAVSKQADFNSSIARWANHMEKSVATFGRQALPMLWDWAEAVPTSRATGGYGVAIDWIANALATVAEMLHRTGNVQLADAARHPLPDDSAAIWFTDPPYYDAVPYAHLADFFFVWLRRTLPEHPLLALGNDSADNTTPKEHEIVVDRPHSLSTSKKDAQFYETGMARAFTDGCRVLAQDGVASVVFAHKTTEGWEALLSGMIQGGWIITGSWPVATEKGARLNAHDTASLATSVHLVCRPRPEDAPIGDWADVLRELPGRVGDWMERLQSEGVRGADLVFACIGPALEIFSRYRRVETADGREVSLAEYLEKVWEVVGRTALEQVLGTAEAKARNGAAGAIEEDARLTALFLWTLQSTNETLADGASDESDEEEYAEDEEEEEQEAAARGRSRGYSLVFDVVRRFAQPLGISLPRWEGRIIETKKGVVRLLAVRERARQLFGKDGTEAVAERLETQPGAGSLQLRLFGDLEGEVAPKRRGRGKKPSLEFADEILEPQREATTLDRVHAAMLLQASGRASALRALLEAEQERGPDFLRLANAPSALYPIGSEEKRLLDAMLLSMPG